MELKKICIKEEWKLAVLAVWIVGLLAHAYRFFNFLPIWDSMFNFKGTGATYSSGRWFLDIVGKISTDYDMPWVNGALSLFYLSCIAVLLIELLEIKGKTAIILTSAVLVTFPTVTSTFSYMFTADGYMLAYLLAVLGVFLTEKYRFGFLAGMLAIALSMSTYQAYLSVSLMVVWIICLKRFLIDEKTVWEAVKLEYKQVIAVVGGAVLNKILTTVVNDYMGVTLGSYQGINDVHLLEIEDCIKNIGMSQLYFRWFLQVGPQREDNWYSRLNTGILLAIIVLTVYYVIRKKLYKKPLELLAVAAVYWFAPIFVFIIMFVSTEVSYHMLMIMSLVLVYVLLIMLIVHMKEELKAMKLVRGIGILVLCGMCYYNILLANYCYFKMNLAYEKSYTIAQDILYRIESLEEFDGTQPIAVIGYYSGEGVVDEIPLPIPEIAGVRDTNFLWDNAHYLLMWQYCMGREYIGASNETVSAIVQTEGYRQLKAYPRANSVGMVDGVVVVKLPFE